MVASFPALILKPLGGGCLMAVTMVIIRGIVIGKCLWLHVVMMGCKENIPSSETAEIKLNNLTAMTKRIRL